MYFLRNLTTLGRHALVRLNRPAPPVRKHPRLSHLGTPYGGWYFVDDESVRGGKILSAGLGEDASFDVELAQRLGCQILLVDPTPRAATHFELIQAHLGAAATSPSAYGGVQPVSSYTLTDLTKSSLTLIKKALAATDNPVRMYPPANPAHNSYSITDWERKRSKQGKFIEFPATTYSQLVDEFLDGHPPPLVKLDIEGAELEVLPDVLERPPLQILVEFDELNLGDRAALRGWRAAHDRLTVAGFVLAHTDALNFTYVHESLY